MPPRLELCPEKIPMETKDFMHKAAWRRSPH